MKERFESWYKNGTDADRAELDSFRGNDKELAERFQLELAFGTAGMRGEVGLGTYRMNIYTVRRATAGVARYVASLGEDAKKRGVVVAYDTRRFSREFAFGAAEVLAAHGVFCHIYEDVRPVPICSFAVRKLQAVAGIMITASHNPKEYNGYKVYGEDGAQMAPAPTAVVVSYIDAITDYFSVPFTPIANIDSYKNADNRAINPYVTVIGKTVDEGYYAAIEKLSLSPKLTATRGKDIKLVYTPVHGAGAIPVTTIFERLGIHADVVREQFAPDTEFSTVEVPNPENADTLRLGIRRGNEIGADVVLATDPDCDRLGVAVRNGEGAFELLTGNQIGALLFDYVCLRLTETGAMPKNAALVKSIVSTTLADRIAKDAGVTTFNVLTGFKYIGEKIKEWEESGAYEYIFGFEESFGTLRGTHARDKDAVVGSMLFAEMLLYHESKGTSVYGRLQALFARYGYYTELNTAVAYKGLTGMADMAAVMKTVRAKTWHNIGNEPVVSVSDYLTGIRTFAEGHTESLSEPASDVVYFSLADGQFICIRPSGTEPKLKIYVLIYAETAEKSAQKAAHLMAAVKKELA